MAIEKKGPTPEEVIKKTQEEAQKADAKAIADAKVAKEKKEAETATTETTTTAEETTTTEETTTSGDTTVIEPVKVSKEEVQSRINRMYARLQGEKEKRIIAETRLDLADVKNKIRTGDEEEIEEKPGLTRQEAEAIWDRKENERKFVESETKVLMRHATALNEDGSFNIDDAFTKSYMDIGRKNPNLAFMVNGPELAEAMVEKQLGISYKKGAQDASTSKVNANVAHTGASTISVSATKITKLGDVEKRIATRMNMTEQQYIDYKAKINKGDKRVVTGKS